MAIIAAALFLVPVPLLAAWGTYGAYTRSPDPMPLELLTWVLSLMWVLWATSPIFVGSMNDALDLSKLLHYPLRRRTIVLSTVFGTIFDFTTWMFVPMAVSIVIAWGAGVNTLLVVLAVFLAWSHMVIGSQLVATVMSGIFNTRRFRDLMVVVGTLFGLAIWGGYMFFRRQDMRDLMAGAGPVIEASPVLKWGPVGALAQTIAASDGGSWAAALAWLAYSTALLLAGTWLWWRLLTRVTANGGVLFAGIASRRERSAASAYRGVFGELVAKEWRLVWRSPERRMQLFQGVLFALVFASWLMWSGAEGAQPLILVPAGLVFLVVLMVHQNIFGAEGHGLATLLLSPIRRSRLLHAKSLLLVCVAAFVLLAISAVALIRGGNPLYLAAGWMLAATVFAPATVVATMISIAEPYPMTKVGKGMFSSGSGGGFVAGMFQTFLMPIAVGAVTAPFWGAMMFGTATDRPALVFGSGVAGMLCAGLMYFVGMRMAERQLLRKEPEILARVTAPQ